jgi:hypothetical protein
VAGSNRLSPMKSTSRCSAESRHRSCETQRRPSALRSAGLGYIEHAAINCAPIESRNRAVPFSIIAHLDKCKTPGPSGFTVCYHIYAVDSPVRLEDGPKGIFGAARAEVSYKNILQVMLLLSETYRAANEGAGCGGFGTMQESSRRTLHLYDDTAGTRDSIPAVGGPEPAEGNRRPPLAGKASPGAVHACR